MDTPSSASARKPRALFLSPESPYPMIGGGPLRSASLLEYPGPSLFRACHRVSTRTAIRIQREPFPPGRVEKLDVIELPHHSKGTLARTLRNSVRIVRNRPPLFDRFSGFDEAIGKLVSGQEYEAAVVEHFWCAPYLEQLRARSKLVILDLHNIESAWHRSLAECESEARALALRRFAAASEALERRWLPQYDCLLVTSADDARVAAEIAPQAKVAVYPNALPEMPLPDRREREEIVFSGNLEYMPNILAVRYFHDRIWPAVRSRRPALKWKIVGKHPQAIQDIVRGDPRIELTGFVADAVQSLATAKVAVVPVHAGSGTRVKILEAWAAGTAVVSTTLGAAGLECRDGEHLLLADDPGNFTDAVLRLLDSPEARRQIGQRAASSTKSATLGRPSGVDWTSVFGNYVAPASV